jgi:hypothetical protein
VELQQSPKKTSELPLYPPNYIGLCFTANKSKYDVEKRQWAVRLNSRKGSSKMTILPFDPQQFLVDGLVAGATVLFCLILQASRGAVAAGMLVALMVVCALWILVHSDAITSIIPSDQQEAVRHALQAWAIGAAEYGIFLAGFVGGWVFALYRLAGRLRVSI